MEKMLELRLLQNETCQASVLAQDKYHLSKLPTSKLRPHASAHRVLNSSRRCKDSVVEELWNHYQSCHSVDMEVIKNSTVNSELTRLETTVDGNHMGSYTTFITQQNQPFLGAMQRAIDPSSNVNKGHPDTAEEDLSQFTCLMCETQLPSEEDFASHLSNHLQETESELSEFLSQISSDISELHEQNLSNESRTNWESPSRLLNKKELSHEAMEIEPKVTILLSGDDSEHREIDILKPDDDQNDHWKNEIKKESTVRKQREHHPVTLEPQITTLGLLCDDSGHRDINNSNPEDDQEDQLKNVMQKESTDLKQREPCTVTLEPQITTLGLLCDDSKRQEIDMSKLVDDQEDQLKNEMQKESTVQKQREPRPVTLEPRITTLQPLLLSSVRTQVSARSVLLKHRVPEENRKVILKCLSCKDFFEWDAMGLGCHLDKQRNFCSGCYIKVYSD